MKNRLFWLRGRLPGARVDRHRLLLRFIRRLGEQCHLQRFQRFHHVEEGRAGARRQGQSVLQRHGLRREGESQGARPGPDGVGRRPVRRRLARSRSSTRSPRGSRPWPRSCPTDAKALIPPLTQLDHRGHQDRHRRPDAGRSRPRPDQIITDNEQGGRLAADAINKLLGGKGKVLVITQPPGSSAQDARTTGFEEELKKYPGHRLSRGAVPERRSAEGRADRHLDAVRPSRARGRLLHQRPGRHRSLDRPASRPAPAKVQGGRLRRSHRRGRRPQERHACPP